MLCKTIDLRGSVYLFFPHKYDSHTLFFVIAAMFYKAIHHIIIAFLRCFVISCPSSSRIWLWYQNEWLLNHVMKNTVRFLNAKKIFHHLPVKQTCLALMFFTMLIDQCVNKYWAIKGTDGSWLKQLIVGTKVSEVQYQE